MLLISSFNLSLFVSLPLLFHCFSSMGYGVIFWGAYPHRIYSASTQAVTRAVEITLYVFSSLKSVPMLCGWGVIVTTVHPNTAIWVEFPRARTSDRSCGPAARFVPSTRRAGRAVMLSCGRLHVARVFLAKFHTIALKIALKENSQLLRLSIQFLIQLQLFLIIPFNNLCLIPCYIP